VEFLEQCPQGCEELWVNVKSYRKAKTAAQRAVEAFAERGRHAGKFGEPDPERSD
jgi:hypothetical protein